MRIVSYGKTFVDNVTVDTKLSNGQLGICTAYGTALPTTGRPEPFVIMSAIPTKDGGFMNQRGVDINPFNFTYNVRKYTEKDQKETIILKGLTNPALKPAEGIVYNADAEFCGAIEICSSEEYRALIKSLILLFLQLSLINSLRLLLITIVLANSKSLLVRKL